MKLLARFASIAALASTVTAQALGPNNCNAGLGPGITGVALTQLIGDLRGRGDCQVGPGPATCNTYVCTAAGGGIALCNDAPYERIFPCNAVADIAEELSRNCYGNGDTGGVQAPSSQVFSLDGNYNVVVGGSC